MLGNKNPTDDLRSALRKAQVQRIVQIGPTMMVANIVNALALCFYFANGSALFPVIIWTAAVIFMGIAGLHANNRFKGRQAPRFVGTKVIRNLTTRSALLAFIWGLFPCFMFYGANAEPSVLTTGIIAGMIGGGCIALSFVPAAMFAYVTTMSLMSAYAIVQHLTPEMITLAVLLLIYSYVVMLGSYGFASSFARTVSKELEIREKADTISLLLNEYEEGGRDWIWETDANGNVTRGAEEFADTIGSDVESWARAVCLSEPCKAEEFGFKQENYDDVRKAFLGQLVMRDIRLGLALKDREMNWFEVSGRPIYAQDGAFLGYRGFSKNRTTEVQDKKHIQFLAEHDSMTNLLTRSTILGLINDAIANIEGDDIQVAVLYIDLDGFKKVNDTKGHAVGDRLLKSVAEKLRVSCGESIPLARIGGDEFAALVPIEDDESEARIIAEKIVSSLCEPFLVDNNEMIIGASVGFAFAKRDGETAEDLINAADVALYYAKSQGKSQAVQFDAGMNEDFKRTVAMREALEKAIDEETLSVAFQPFFAADTQRLCGFEALARWKHEEFGDVAPGVFIPIAEEAGLIDKLGDWVLREACKRARDWPGYLRLAVNVSVPQFHRGEMAARVRGILEATQFNATRLELEITEGVFAERPDEVLRQIKQIKSQGVSISLDDFGTGYSSLMYLVNFPFDKLKIDQSFVRKAQRDQNARNVLNTIAELGRVLKMETTIEGVEHVEQLPLISELNCTYVQGYHFGRPMDMGEMAICIANDARKMISVEQGKVAQKISA